MTRARDLSRLINPNGLTLDTNFNVGVGSTTPDVKLDVIGIVSATSFYGDGSNLTGINAGTFLYDESGSQRLVLTSLLAGIMTSGATSPNLVFDATTNTLSSGTFSGNIAGAAATFTGNIIIGAGSTVGFGYTAYFSDNAKVVFGNGEDLSIYHDGTNSYIKSLTGTTVFNVDTLRVNNSTNTENILEADANGAVKLYFDNSKKLETISIGVTVSGSLVSSAGTLGSNGNGTRTVSASSPTGGVDGDIWYQY